MNSIDCNHKHTTLVPSIVVNLLDAGDELIYIHKRERSIILLCWRTTNLECTCVQLQYPDSLLLICKIVRDVIDLHFSHSNEGLRLSTNWSPSIATINKDFEYLHLEEFIHEIVQVQNIVTNVK